MLKHDVQLQAMRSIVPEKPNLGYAHDKRMHAKSEGGTERLQAGQEIK